MKKGMKTYNRKDVVDFMTAFGCVKKNKYIDYNKFCFNSNTKYELEEYDNLLNYDEDLGYTR